jgi:hypothetical protein
MSESYFLRETVRRLRQNLVSSNRRMNVQFVKVMAVFEGRFIFFWRDNHFFGRLRKLTKIRVFWWPSLYNLICRRNIEEVIMEESEIMSHQFREICKIVCKKSKNFCIVFLGRKNAKRPTKTIDKWHEGTLMGERLGWETGLIFLNFNWKINGFYYKKWFLAYFRVWI